MRGNGIIPTAGRRTRCWRGADYGLDAEAGRLAYRWLYTIVKNAHDYNGVIPEKYNVVTGSHKVFVEYGNVGTKFAYIATEGFGWMNASFEVGMNFLSPAQLADLHIPTRRSRSQEVNGMRRQAGWKLSSKTCSLFGREILKPPPSK